MDLAYDRQLQTILDFDSQDVELNRENLFSSRQNEFLGKAIKEPDSLFYFMAAFMTVVIAISVLCSLSPWDSFVSIEIPVLLFALFGSFIMRLARHLKVREIISEGIQSETGRLNPVADQRGEFRRTTIEIGSRHFIVTEDTFQALVQLIDKTDPVYYRVYYPRRFPDLLLSLERLV
jgi:hypothetical protein